MLLWLGIGFFAGGFASRFLDDTLSDTLVDILLGVVGSFFTGFLLYKLGTQKSSIDVFQVMTVLLSAVVFIWIRKSIKSQVV